MCGIVGIVGKGEVAPLLVDALKRLEYRGYDSAGVATVHDGRLDRRRAEGKLANLDHKLGQEPLAGHVGIGHTRWATHGAPTESNAHPHFCNGVAVVHNGIIENFAPLRAELTGKGATFYSQTDTEVVAQLLSAYRGEGLAPRLRRDFGICCRSRTATARAGNLLSGWHCNGGVRGVGGDWCGGNKRWRTTAPPAATAAARYASRRMWRAAGLLAAAKRLSSL